MGLLAVSGCAPVVMWSALTPDHSSRIEITERKGQQQILNGQEASPWYDGIAPASVTQSANGGRLAYAALQEGHWFVVLDGEPGQLWDGIGEIRLSESNSAYTSTRKGDWFVVVRNAQEQVAGPFESVTPGSLVFDPVTNRWAFVVESEGAKQVVAGEKRCDGYVSDLYFESGVTHFVADHPNGGVAVISDCLTGEPYQEIRGLTVRNGTVAFAGHREGQWYGVVNQRQMGPFDEIMGVTLSTDGADWGFQAAEGSEQFVLTKAGPSKAYDLVTSLVTRGGRWAFVGVRDGVWMAVVDGNESEGFPHIGPIALSQTGESAFVVNGTTVHHSSRRYSGELIVPESLIFSDDGQHVGYLAGNRRKRELYLSIDGLQTQIPFDWADLVGRLAVQESAVQTAEDGANLVRDWVSAEMRRYLGR